MPLYRELGGGEAMKGFEQTFQYDLSGAERWRDDPSLVLAPTKPLHV